MKICLMVLPIILLSICACTSRHKLVGWYPLSDYPDNTIVGKPLATVKDFKMVEFKKDTLIIEGDTVRRIYIYGEVKPEIRNSWADATEKLIGHRLGFIFNDSVIMSPNLNARMESGSFEIVSPDTNLLKNIYKSLIIDLGSKSN